MRNMIRNRFLPAGTRRLANLSVFAIGMALSLAAHAASLNFALFGDVHMTADHQGYLKGMLDDMARRREDLAIFTGGVKPVEQGCQDTNLLTAYPVFATSPLPTFYVPGDAEWASCTQFAPEERLNLLRKTFYPKNRSLGDPSLPLTRQADYPEMMRWETGPALFVTLNIAGANNRWGPKAEASAEFQSRNAAGLVWLHDAFQLARDHDAHVVIIVMHGDPEFDNPGVSESSKGYKLLLEQLKSETGNFSGQVLLVHGGSGVHRIDHPLLNASNLPYQNFTRVATYGASQQGWVQVLVEKNDKTGSDPVNRVTFRFESFPWPPLTEIPTDSEVQPNDPAAQ